MTRTARASVIHEFGPEEILVPSDFPLPSVGPKQLLIRLKAFGINELELKIRAGKFRPYLFKRPFVLGMDGAGVVEEVGSDVTKFKKGDRVWFFEPVTGAYANLCLTSEDLTYHLHPSLSFEEGAILPVPYMTVHRALIQHGGFKKGDSLLVQGASGAVGVAAVQVAKGLGASRIIGTAGTEDGIKLALQHGADVVLNYKDKDFKESLQKEVGKGANIILETNADVNFDMDLDLVAKRGHIVIVGKRGPCQCDVAKVLAKESRVTGSALLWSTADERQENADDIYKYCEEGWLKPYVGKVYKFSDIPQSHIDMANRKGAMGKVAVSLE